MIGCSELGGDKVDREERIREADRERSGREFGPNGSDDITFNSLIFQTERSRGSS